MNLTVLWLDDQRNPLTYFKKKDEKGEGTLHDNLVFYQNLSKKYNLQFVWVKNYNEFVNYIEKNGIPQFVSFDHDLSKTSLPTDPKGLDCAKWLVSYCKKNGKQMPMTYVHSANPKWRGVIRNVLNGTVSEEKKSKKIYITEEQFKKFVQNTLFEGVYVNGIKGKKANLTYKKGQKRSPGSLSTFDNLNTDKMDVDNSDTYEVTLKGGITSYNITSINGTEVMHYFKRYFDHQKAEIQLKNSNGEKESYELQMEANEFNQFMNQFIRKIEFVINYCLKKFHNGSGPDFSGISIYPVASSSNFNVEMAKQIAGKNLCNLPVQVIDERLFLKDLRNLQKDKDFIEKNKDFYNGPLSNVEGNTSPVMDYLDRDIAKYNALKPAAGYLEQMTKLAKTIITQLYQYRQAQKNPSRDTSRMIRSMVENYKQYYEYYRRCLALKYNNPITKNESGINLDSFAEQLKYSKDPQIEIRSKEVWSVIGKYLRGQKNPIDGKPYKEFPLQGWTYKNFQIKNLSNGERMGLKGIYNLNTDTELVKREIEKVKGTVFIVFDDNVSGGATLSDICYQVKEHITNFIIPITFGVMDEKWTMGIVPLNRPKNGKFVY